MDDNNGSSKGRWIAITLIALVLVLATIGYERTAIVYQQTTRRVTICLGIWFGTAVYFFIRKLQEYRQRAEDAEYDLASSSDARIVSDAREEAAYYRDRTRSLEKTVAELRANIAELSAGATEASYWVERYRPKTKQAPEGEERTADSRFKSQTGRTGAEQREMAYQMHVAGRSNEDIAAELHLSKSSVSKYIREGSKIAHGVMIDNPHYDPDPPILLDPWRNPRRIQVDPGSEEYAKVMRERYGTESNNEPDSGPESA